MICKTAYKKDAKNGCDLIIVTVILCHGNQHYRVRHLLIRAKKSPSPILCIKASTLETSIVLRSCFTKLYRLLIIITERDILLKMNISNNSKMILEKCSTSTFIVRSPSSSFIRSSIAASVVNIVLVVAWTISDSLVLFIFWKSPELRSKVFSFIIMLLCSIDVGVGTVVHPFVLVKSYHYKFGFPEMCVHWDLCRNNIVLLWHFGMYSFDYQYWEIFRDTSPIFVPNSFHQTKVCGYLDLFLVPCRSLDSISCLFLFFGSSYPSCSLNQYSFHIFVHLRCNIRRWEKKDDKKRSPQ